MSVWPSVREAFVTFSVEFEGFTDFLYQDTLGLITCGIGNLVDTQPPSAEPTQMVLDLPWLRADGSRASRDDIADAWHAIRSRDDLRMKGGGAYKWVTSIRLSRDAVGQLVKGKFDENDRQLSKRFPNYYAWPADAQLGLHGMSWAMGPAFKYPAFAAAANANPPDFITMAKECKMTGKYALRNVSTALLFLNAAAVQARRGDPARLFYPGLGPVGVATIGWSVGGLLMLGGAAGLAWHFYSRRWQTLSAGKPVATTSPSVPARAPPTAGPYDRPARSLVASARGRSSSRNNRPEGATATALSPGPIPTSDATLHDGARSQVPHEDRPSYLAPYMTPTPPSPPPQVPHAGS